MKIAVVTHSSPYEPRAEAVGAFFAGEGHEVTYVYADFDHHAKRTLERKTEGHVYLHMLPYRGNLSLRRIISLRRFAGTTEAYLSGEHFDLLYLMIPLNGYLKMAARMKKKQPELIVVADILDLWPESLPFPKGDWLLPVRFWRQLRDRYIGAADLIFSECAYYREFLPAVRDRMHTLYWFLDEHTGETETSDVQDSAGEDQEEGIRLVYLGGINHILDIGEILGICLEIRKKKKVHLSVIGDGDNRALFLDALDRAQLPYTYYGTVYDPEKKRQIISGCHFGLNLMKASVCVGLSMKSIDYLFQGIPLLNNLQGDTWKIVEEEGIGINHSRGDYAQTAGKLLHFLETQKTQDKVRIRQFWQRNFSHDAFKASLREGLRDLPFPVEKKIPYRENEEG